MRRLKPNGEHLYFLLKAYDTMDERITWTQALKRCKIAINPQEFESLSNLAATSGYLSGLASRKMRTKKYWREHKSIEFSNFSFFRTLSTKGRDFIAAYETVQDHMNTVYPEDLQKRAIPPERITLQIIGKPRTAPDGTMKIPVRIIQDETP